jgi:hypothetical protein
MHVPDAKPRDMLSAGEPAPCLIGFSFMKKANERRLLMKTAIRNGALALGLIAGAALMTAPAMANSVHEEGHFGGSWSKIEPSSGYYQRRRHAGRVGPLYGERYYRGPAYYPRGYAYYAPRRSYYYGAPYYYDYGPGIGFGFSIR